MVQGDLEGAPGPFQTFKRLRPLSSIASHAVTRSPEAAEGQGAVFDME